MLRMERWQNKVAVVTGASSGIGAAIAADLVRAGFTVVALARREIHLINNQSSLSEDLQIRYHPFKCDIADEEQVQIAFNYARSTFGSIDVLVHSAGTNCPDHNLSDLDNTSDMQEVVNTNIMGVVYCVREAFNCMKELNSDGHIVIVNSVAGHQVPYTPGRSQNIYPATKHAVTAMVETYRQEFAAAGTKVKVTSVSPGAVDTEFDPEIDAKRNSGVPLLNPHDVSNAVLYVLSTPPHVQVHELVIKPLGENF